MALVNLKKLICQIKDFQYIIVEVFNVPGILKPCQMVRLLEENGFLTLVVKIKYFAFIVCCLVNLLRKHGPSIDGTSRWKDGNHLLTSHETSTVHIAASIDATIHEHCAPLLPALDEKKEMEVQTNRVFVKQLIDISLFLAKHGLAFRSHKEKWTDSIRGNFKDRTFKILLAEYSPVLSSYITCLKRRENLLHL